MNALNRLVVVLLLALIAGVSILLAVQPLGVAAAVGQLALYLRGVVETGYYAGLVAVCCVLVVLVLVLVFLELRRGRRLTVKVSRSGGASVELSTESVARSIEYHVAQVAGIRQVRPRVLSTGGAVRVMLDLEIDPVAGIPEKSEEVVAQTREVVEGRLGLRIAGLTVKVRQGAFTKDAAPGVAEAQPPAPGAGVAL